MREARVIARGDDEALEVRKGTDRPFHRNGIQAPQVEGELEEILKIFRKSGCVNLEMCEYGYELNV